ncbi:MAG: LacI family transcriptional regulator, partial [Firmicutes bacterium]|nr:LacI family transcriptional regulator [Bacillota bacterium]
MKKAPTIYDIARIANVSAATVSRALNDSPLIKTETKKLISKIADDLSYRPNLTARALITSKTDTLALFYHTTARLISEDPMFLNIMDGVNFESHTAGYTLLFSAVSENLEDSRVINSITS